MTIIEHLEKVEKLLAIEKQEDFEQYRSVIQKLSLAERREKGYSWHPLVVTRTGYTVGERAFLIVERTKNLDNPHQFRAGSTVNLFTQNTSAYKPERSGIIQFVNKNRMKIVLNSKDLPDWLNDGQIGVDIQFDERTYLEMERALKLVKLAKGDRLAELRDIILGKVEPSFLSVENPTKIPLLNESQNTAVTNILAAKDVAVVHGPPGTGKTTTLVYAIQMLCQTESTVLVTAPSNTAVDLLTERLANQGLRVVRVGNISRVDENLLRHTLEFQLSNHPEAKHIKKVRQEAAEARRQERKMRTKRQWTEQKMYRQEAYDLSQWAKQLEDRLLDQLLDSAQVVCCTFVGSSNKILHKRKFRTVVVDEAAQALEPASWISILKASKVVLAGDPHQLPPTVKSFQAQREGLGITLIERCIEHLKSINFLDVQYRMNQAIMGFSNKIFYNNTLKAAPDVQFHRLDIVQNEPVIYIDTAGCGFEEKYNPEYKSRYNPDEFQILCEHLYLLVKAYEGQELPSIALISPYREQVIYMKSIVSEDPILSEVPLVINTIDGFQGQEKDVVYISLVRSNDKQEIGFLKDYRRMNVAMTRARKQLIVVGDSATIGANEFYQQFIEYCEQEAVYQTGWDYML